MYESLRRLPTLKEMNAGKYVKLFAVCKQASIVFDLLGGSLVL